MRLPTRWPSRVFLWPSCPRAPAEPRPPAAGVGDIPQQALEGCSAPHPRPPSPVRRAETPKGWVGRGFAGKAFPRPFGFAQGQHPPLQLHERAFSSRNHYTVWLDADSILEDIHETLWSRIDRNPVADPAGRWRCRRCAAAQVKSGKVRLDCRYHRLGTRSCGGSLCGWSNQRSALESGHYGGLCDGGALSLDECLALHWRSDDRCIFGSGARLAGLSRALGSNGRSGIKTSGLFHHARHSQHRGQCGHRSDRNLRTGFWLPRAGRQQRPHANRPDATSGWLSGVGHWAVTWRSHGLCHQSSARSRPAHRARNSSHPRKRQFRLGICLGAGCCAADRRDFRRGSLRKADVKQTQAYWGCARCCNLKTSNSKFSLGAVLPRCDQLPPATSPASPRRVREKGTSSQIRTMAVSIASAAPFHRVNEFGCENRSTRGAATAEIKALAT